MIDTKLYSLVELYSELSEELFDVFYPTIDSVGVNFCSDDIVSFMVSKIHKYLDSEPYVNKVIYKSCEPYDNWRGDTRANLLTSMHPQLNIMNSNVNNGIHLVWNRLDKPSIKCLQIKSIDYIDFAETCVILVGKPFITTQRQKYANFLDNNLYYHEKRVIIDSEGIPLYIKEEIRNQLKINEII